MKKYKYTEDDYEELRSALMDSNSTCNGRPDIYQYYQNKLSRTVAEFLLKPYLEGIKENGVEK